MPPQYLPQQQQQRTAANVSSILGAIIFVATFTHRGGINMPTLRLALFVFVWSEALSAFSFLGLLPCQVPAGPQQALGAWGGGAQPYLHTSAFTAPARPQGAARPAPGVSAAGAR